MMVTVGREPHKLHYDTTPETAPAPGVHDERPEELDGELWQIYWWP